MGTHSRAAVVLLLVVAGGLLIIPRLVRRAAPFFLYHPAPLSSAASSPSHWGISRGQEVWLHTSDGVRLHAWWVSPSGGAGDADGPPRPSPDDSGSGPGEAGACGTVLFFHGNAGHLADRAEIARRLSRRGLNVLLPDYRGYGRSQGEPSEEGLYRDAVAAYRYVVDRRGVSPGRVVVAGHSLGGAVAVALSSQARVGGLVVTAAFRSLPEIARDLYPWLPGSWFEWAEVPYPTLDRMSRVSTPVLVGRGSRDQLIPRSHVRALYEAAPDPKRWVEAEGAGHNDLWSEPGYWRALDRFLADTLGCDLPRSG